ncbi:uncharacterized protein BDZ99DRAFT_467060 [Mytilinidion resinicola]|uniref:Uncharacterized protein n=1 Tax=Mytilinidion resinicola TaxID=574789 RepID=A0A6A6YAF4_9PEZI|nr:uncharacterized protein BDZ99DRAFT_467060 [Mytilinidion resinicola]KAF2804807.1 hypothetical protein BDZ99DRAFT_467060 [Mytilinidion resinicola]
MPDKWKGSQDRGIVIATGPGRWAGRSDTQHSTLNTHQPPLPIKIPTIPYNH